VKKPLTRKEARAFRTRWEMVNAAERAELLTTPLDRKLRQLAALEPLGVCGVLVGKALYEGRFTYQQACAAVQQE